MTLFRTLFEMDTNEEGTHAIRKPFSIFSQSFDLIGMPELNNLKIFTRLTNKASASLSLSSPQGYIWYFPNKDYARKISFKK